MRLMGQVFKIMYTFDCKASLLLSKHDRAQHRNKSTLTNEYDANAATWPMGAREPYFVHLREENLEWLRVKKLIKDTYK